MSTKQDPGLLGAILFALIIGLLLAYAIDDGLDNHVRWLDKNSLEGSDN